MKSLTYQDIQEIITIATDIRLFESANENTEIALDSSLMQSIHESYNYVYPLIEKLEALNKLALQEVCALMWIGRDDAYNASDWDYAVKDAIYIEPVYLIEKIRLDQYLTDGLKKIGLDTQYYDYCIQFSNQQKHLLTSVDINDVAQNLYHLLAENPQEIYKIPPRKFEELVADMLQDWGYEVCLTKQTKDGGRDILAYYQTPVGRILTIVECKRYAETRKIGIDIVERFLYVLAKDEASVGMVVTTSYFSEESRKIEKGKPYKLFLKDFNDIQDWLSKYGRKYEQNNSGIWLPRPTTHP